MRLRLLLVLLVLAFVAPVSAQVVTGVLDSLNDTVEVDLSGRPGATVLIATSGMLATVVAETKLDGGEWEATKFSDVNGTLTSTIDLILGPQTVQRAIVPLVGGLVRVRVSIYISGAATVTLTGVAPATTISNTVGAGGGGDGKILDGTAAGEADVVGLAPAGTEQGLVTRNIPSGTQQVGGTVGVSGSVAVTGPLTDAELRAAPVPVSGTVSVTEPVSVDDNGGSLTVDATSLPLPTGAETAALQLPDGHNVTVDNAGGGAAVPIQDGGNSITVDGPLTDAQLRATPVPVSISGGGSGDGKILDGAGAGEADVGATFPAINDQALSVREVSGYRTFFYSLNPGVIGDAAGIAVEGLTRVLIFNATAWGGSTVQVEATVGATGIYVPVPVYRLDSTTGRFDDAAGVTTLTSATWAAQSVFMFENPGFAHFRLRNTGISGAGAVNVTLTASRADGPQDASQSCDSYVSVNVSSATTTLLVTGSFPKTIRICSVNLVTANANNVALISGTGATCGTGTSGLSGGTTAASGWNFAANGGIAQGSGDGYINRTTNAGENLCIVTSAATQLSGRISYAIN